MRVGALVYDCENNSIDVRYGPSEFHGGIRWGEQFDVMVNGVWYPTRLLKENGRWQLRDVYVDDLNGLVVRMFP